MIFPKFRAFPYAIWRACERIGIRPPGVKENWDDCDWWTQCHLIGFSQIREYEEAESASAGRIN